MICVDLLFALVRIVDFPSPLMGGIRSGDVPRFHVIKILYIYILYIHSRYIHIHVCIYDVCVSIYPHIHLHPSPSISIHLHPSPSISIHLHPSPSISIHLHPCVLKHLDLHPPSTAREVGTCRRNLWHQQRSGPKWPLDASTAEPMTRICWDLKCSV